MTRSSLSSVKNGSKETMHVGVYIHIGRPLTFESDFLNIEYLRLAARVMQIPLLRKDNK